LAVAGERDCFLSDSRYTGQARAEVLATELREYRVKAEGVAAWLAEQGTCRVGFEAEHLSCAALRRLQERSPAGLEWVPLELPVAALRGIKSSAEIAALETAAALTAAAFDEVLPLLQPGVSEREISLALEIALKTRGGDEKAFDFIVASGQRGALPHGVASEKLLAAGELVTIDFGVRWHGYHSDETVTLAIGEIGEKLREIYAVVLEAHDRAIAAIRPGVPLREIDAVARDYIVEQGFGDYFGHGLGHGVGLEVHEFPTVSPRSEDVAEEGMVFTIEPGIYIPELGGVRIEDMVLVTADSCRTLTRLNKNLLVLAD
jgi:Xaa-Pro aminopeptidase